METNYTWFFSNPDCIISADGMNQIVHTIHWVLTGERDGQAGYYYSATSLPLPTGDKFTPYNELPKEWFISQVEINTDMEFVYGNIDAQIDLNINPVIDNPTLPFAN